VRESWWVWWVVVDCKHFNAVVSGVERGATRRWVVAGVVDGG